MTSLIQSTLILAFARTTNFALLIFGPIILVRILDQTSFGQYREFMAYAMLIANLSLFSISSNLLFFVPKHREFRKQYVTNTAYLLATTSAIACLMVWLFRSQVTAKTSFDFIVPLTLYVVLFTNLSYLESYWIAVKEPKKVFYYSVVRTTLRLSAVIGTAWFSRSVLAILTALIVVEFIRLIVVLAYSISVGVLSWRINKSSLIAQLKFAVPLGLAGSLHFANQYIGPIAVSAHLGVLALAIYSIASYQVPILRIVRGAISDSIFPDMVRQASMTAGDRLNIWKKGNVAYTFLILPVFVLLGWYADILIPLVFTEKYVDAIPLFRVLILVLPIQCIELSSPLRAVNETASLLSGNILMLCVNLITIAVFFNMPDSKAIFGPAIGLVLGFIVQHVYLAWKIVRRYRIRLRDLLKWRSLFLIVVCLAIVSVFLVVGNIIIWPKFLEILVSSTLFVASYFVLLYRMQIDEVRTVVDRLFLRRKSFHTE